MKLSKKFIEDLHKIGEDAFIEKNQWIGKLVPDIIIDNLQKRGISQEDIEGTVCLTIDQAKALLRRVPMFQMSADWMHPIEVLKAKIEQAEMSIAST